MPLNVSEAEAERIAAKLVDVVQHAPEKEEPSESPSKRVNIHHCAEVKDWFLASLDHMNVSLFFIFIFTDFKL